MPRLEKLLAKRPKNDESFSFTGVLLSDAIEYCVKDFDLIAPFSSDHLKPANYKLRIGNEYAIRGEIKQLSDEPGKNQITIQPFDVAVIKTLETLNMPRFLIARWNIRVQLAYEGLLWVGGPQVDAGYVGHLFCPIYNLSDKPVTLKYGDYIAVIDFIKTTPFHEGSSKDYPGPLPERILFEDYNPEKLKSALYEIATTRLGKVEDRTTATERKVTDSLRDSQEKTDANIKDMQTRVDTFVLITFTVIAVLFAAVTIFATRGENKPTWDFVLFLTSLTSVLALLCSATVWLQMRRVAKAFGSTLQVVILFIFAALIAANAYQFGKNASQKIEMEDLKKRVDQLQEQVSKPLVVPATPAVPNKLPVEKQVPPKSGL